MDSAEGYAGTPERCGAGSENGSTALVAHLQRMSTEDGPGIRTTVFLKGCSLACTWCHNPECLSPRPEVVWHAVRCIGCGECARACPTGSLELGPGGVVIDRERCQGCGTCAEACPSTAMELVGRRLSVGSLVCEVAKDRSYFASSGGGVTVSGGEPLLQPRFLEAFLKRCRALGIRSAVDTCGLCGRQALLEVSELCDLLLYDLKLMDPAKHAAFTGQGNEKILDNLLALGDSLRSRDRGPALWIRTPLIPGATAEEGNVGAIGKFIARELGGLVERWELCAFNNLCRDKYLRLGRKWAFAECDLLEPEVVESLIAVARNSGVDAAIVRATGATRLGSVRGASKEEDRLPTAGALG